MPPTQDPTTPTTDSVSHLSWDNVDIRPMLWIYGTGLTLLFAGLLIARVSPPSAGTWSWQKAGFLLWTLSMFVFFAIPGALVATRHAWGAVFHLVLQKRYAHPRLFGLAEVWAGLVSSGAFGVILFVPDQLSSTRYWLFAWYLEAIVLGVVAVAPILALYLFDRRR